jgi:hypothetical protein
VTAAIEAIAAHAVEFDLAAIARSTPTVFVYVLVDKGEIVYVGRTVAIAQRLSFHAFGTTQHDPKTFDRALVMEVPREDGAAIEGALIRRFNPPLTHGAPGNETRDVEVLNRLGIGFDQANRDAFVARRRQLFVSAHSRARVRDLARRGWRSHRFSRTLWKATCRWLAKQVNEVAA